MNKLLAGVFASCVALFSSWALADEASLYYDSLNMKQMTPAQTAQLRAERDTAKEKWAAMTPAEKAALDQSVRSKKIGDMTAIDRFGLDDNMKSMMAQTSGLNAQNDAAKAKWEAMTPEQKTAARKAIQQKKLAELGAMERVGQNDDMSDWLNK